MVYVLCLFAVVIWGSLAYSFLSKQHAVVLLDSTQAKRRRVDR